jgi:hypothetical protein
MTRITFKYYDAFEVSGAIFRELEWKTPIFYGRAVPKIPYASFVVDLLLRLLDRDQRLRGPLHRCRVLALGGQLAAPGVLLGGGQRAPRLGQLLLHPRHVLQ